MNAKEVLKILYGHGFSQVSQKGSHLKLSKDEKRLSFQYMEQRIYL